MVSVPTLHRNEKAPETERKGKIPYRKHWIYHHQTKGIKRYLAYGPYKISNTALALI